MNLQTILSFGILASATAAQFYSNQTETQEPKAAKEPKEKKTKGIKETKIKTTVEKPGDLADKLEKVQFLIGGVKKGLKWTKKGMKQFILASRSGLFSQDFRQWVMSAKAFELYTLLGGSIFLAYRNMKPSKIEDSFLKKFSSISWTVIGESRKITESYNLINSLSEFAKNPQSNFLPLTFAATMIAVRQFAGGHAGGQA